MQLEIIYTVIWQFSKTCYASKKELCKVSQRMGIARCETKYLGTKQPLVGLIGLIKWWQAYILNGV